MYNFVYNHSLKLNQYIAMKYILIFDFKEKPAPVLYTLHSNKSKKIVKLK